MAAAQGTGWRAPKRLRQLESVAGRGLLLGCGSKQQAPAAHYVTLAARCPSTAVAENGAAGGGSSSEEEWRLIYRSEAAGGTSNPEWRPLAWREQQLLQQDPLLDSSSVQLLLALHAVEPAGTAGTAGAAGGGAPAGDAGEKAAAGAAAAAAGPGLDGQQAASGLDCPLLFAAAERPVLRPPAVPSLPDIGSSGLGSRPVSNSAEAEEPAAPEPAGSQQAAAAGASHRPHAAAEGGDEAQQPVEQLAQQQEQQLPPQQEQEHEQRQNGVHPDAALEPGQQQAADARGETRQQQAEEQQPASKGQPSKSDVAGAVEAVSAECSSSSAAAAAAAAAAAESHARLPAGDHWPAAAAAALAATGACPGRLVAAWRLDSLGELFPAGADLSALRQPLQPNTLVLSFGGAGLCLCPPPLQQEAAGPGTAPPSLQASPLKRSQLPSATATAGEERGADGAAPGPGRRFASLLVSKLLRSTANLQEAGSLGSNADLAAELAGAGASSDAESDAGSDATSTTAATRRTTATAPNELPGATAAGPTAAGALPGGGGSSRTAAAAAAATAAAGMGSTTGGGSAATKTLTLASAHQCVSSLVALQSRLRDLAGRSQALQQQLGQRLGPQRQRRRQDAALAALADEAARCRRQAAEVQQQVAEVHAAAVAAKKQATVRAQALVTVLKVMAAADRRVGEAEAALRGEEGRGALTAVLRELVACRCHTVCQLGAIFRLGPTAVSIPQAPPGGFLEDRLERQWAGAASSEGGGSGSLALAAAAGPARYGSSSFGLDGFGSGADANSKYRQEMRLSIGGLEVRPSVWRKAFDDGGYESDAGEDRAAGVALGYVAQMVDRLAAYLDVPLRYPLALRGSRSAVIDSYPPAGTWAEAEEEGGARRPLFGRGGGDAAAAAAAAAQRVEYPLYCDSNRERPRFAVGVFLLNKDVIQLLQAHGISAAGPNHLLHNLHKLLLAAQSGLPAPRALAAS